MFDLGDTYPAAYQVVDEGGNPVNAATVTLTITLPDGSTFEPAVTNPPAVTGQYQASYVTTTAGRHVVRWVTISPATAYTDVFDVAEALPPAIFSLADGKQVLNIDPSNTSDDDELRAKIAGITKAIEAYKKEAIPLRTVTQTQWARRERLRLWQTPVVSLSSLASADGTYIWDVTKMDVDSETGLVEALSGPALRGKITSVHLAGYQIIPYNYLEGAKVLLQYEWETRRGIGTVGSGVVGPDEAMDYRAAVSGSLLPRKVRDWLGSPGQVVA